MNVTGSVTDRIPQPLTSENFPASADDLGARFPELRRILDAHGMPEFWHRSPGFETLSLIILEQQVSLLAAERAYARIEAGIGKLTPDSIHRVGETRLRELGITRQKSRYLSALADAVLDQSLDLEGLKTKQDEVVLEELTRFPGIGPWTANVYLMSALCRPDVWPPGDLALIKSVRTLLPGASGDLEKTGERWKPMRGVAARLLWHWYLSR